MRLGSGEKAYIGDRVLFRRNHRGTDVRNGETGTVVSFHRAIVTTPLNPGAISVRMDDGRKIRVDLGKYKDLSLGYALTTHKAQGATVDEAFVYTTPERAARDMIYVQASRQRESLQVYAPGHDLGEDLAAMERGAGRDSSGRELATTKHRNAELDKLLDRPRDDSETQRERTPEEEERSRRRGFGMGLGLERGR